ncbi:hypothetical protein L6164_033201 [Bauhinia variegata]|uniref:Uncharacterized protein n=1 Tax=Bauhinia variegata TaxID=167791 RepID=A0ACB9KR89_BAUVA|nr:hypothetical protein L6164_033201 [Bauhinia variegata]
MFDREMKKFPIDAADASKGSNDQRQRVTRENSENEQENIEDQSEMKHKEERESDQGGYSIDIPSFIDGRNQSISVYFNDGVLDCFICYEALSIPVFQCRNGHIICSSCCVKVKNKCPMCSKLICNRCKAIENVLKSVQISCANAPFGCEKTTSYSKKKGHEKKCSYAPCFCPRAGCNFVASSKELALHFRSEHGWSPISFEFGAYFSVSLNISDEITILQEKNDGNLFVLSNDVKDDRYVIGVTCITAHTSEAPFHNRILTPRTEGLCRRKLQSFIPNSQGPVAITPALGLSLLSRYFSSDGELKLHIRIGRDF